MRLIDAEPVLSYIDRLQNSGLGKGKTLEYIAKFLENQPTAYDVKSVVEKLEAEGVGRSKGMKVKDIVQISNKITGEDVVAMPLWVWKLTGRKPFCFLTGWIVMDYKFDPQCEKSGLWHLRSAFKAWRMYR